MSVPQEHTTAALMLCAITPRGHTTARANRDITEMEEIVKVKNIASLNSRCIPFWCKF